MERRVNIFEERLVEGARNHRRGAAVLAARPWARIGAEHGQVTSMRITISIRGIRIPEACHHDRVHRCKDTQTTRVGISDVGALCESYCIPVNKRNLPYHGTPTVHLYSHIISNTRAHVSKAVRRMWQSSQAQDVLRARCEVSRNGPFCTRPTPITSELCARTPLL